MADDLNRNGDVRIVVVDDHAAVRAGLERILRREPGFKVVAALDGGRDLADVTTREAADVVILDYELADSDGLALCQSLKHRSPSARVLIYSAHTGPGLLVPAAIAQADAVVSKAEPIEALVATIRRIHAGERLLGPPAPELLHAVTARVDPEDAPVVLMLMDGATVVEIASALRVPEREILGRSHRILGRLHPRRRARRTQPVA
jgi:two-component system response regulator DesR